MANANSLTVIAQRVGIELDLLFVIENAALDAIAAGSITSARYLRNSRWGTDHFSSQNYIITRMASATAADNERYAGDLTNTTGLLAHTGANYADTTTTSETVEMWKAGIRRTTDVLNAINRALANLFYSTFVPLSDLSGGSNDGDNASAATTAYTSVGTPTLSKSTTATRTPYGLRSLRCLSSGADEGVQTATILARQDRLIRYGVISSADVGGVTYNAWDVDNAANFTTLEANTHSEEEPQMVWSPWGQIPDTCKQVAIRGIGTATDADIYHNMFWLYRQGNSRIELPSYVTEAYETPSIFQARPMYMGGTSNVWDALSLEFTPLQEGVDYRYIVNQPDASPTAILLLHDRCLDWPLLTQSRRAYSPLSAEADTTACPLKLVVPAAKIELLMAVGIPGWPGGQVEWARQHRRAVDQFTEATTSRTLKRAAGARPYYAGQPRIG